MYFMVDHIRRRHNFYQNELIKAEMYFRAALFQKAEGLHFNPLLGNGHSEVKWNTHVNMASLKGWPLFQSYMVCALGLGRHHDSVRCTKEKKRKKKEIKKIQKEWWIFSLRWKKKKKKKRKDVLYVFAIHPCNSWNLVMSGRNIKKSLFQDRKTFCGKVRFHHLRQSSFPAF